VDASKPESVVNLTGSRGGVLAAAAAFFAAGVALLVRFCSAAGDQRVAAMLGAAIACGYVYQGPPFRWGRGAGWRGEGPARLLPGAG
jgi:1,4-dihydroxy-2-naphthoate octaprenyltransferase